MSPTWPMYVAMSLELGMLACFIQARSVPGIVLWLVYLYWSATRAFVFGLWRRDGE